jgi:hypothetical protein
MTFVKPDVTKLFNDAQTCHFSLFSNVLILPNQECAKLQRVVYKFTTLLKQKTKDSSKQKAVKNSGKWQLCSCKLKILDK